MLDLAPIASFRDPSGTCVRTNDRTFRFVHSTSIQQLEDFLGSASADSLTAGRQLVTTRSIDDSQVGSILNHRPSLSELRSQTGAWYEHDTVEFPSFPHEWPPEMLHAAASLTLEVAQQTLREGFGLKDATPFNILFRGAEPVFVDLLSFEQRDPADPVWNPYAQFVRTFLLPLLVNRVWGMRLADIFVTHRDGLEPEEVFRMCGPLQKLLPPILSLVSLPTWLSARANDRMLYEQNHRVGREKARFILELLFKRLDRTVVKLTPCRTQDSSWRGYMKMHSYAGASFAMKEGFVEAALVESRPRRVLDIGANTGHFSLLAARHGASVVAIDSDAVCVGALWNEARKQSADILPLVIDISRPSPALGWRNRECPGFLDRACGALDCVLMLAVLHHLLIRERIPLQEVLDLAARLTTDWLVIEYIAPEDEMFRQLARGQGELYTTLTRETFEAAAERQFRILRSAQVPDSHRWLYLLRRKGVDSIEAKKD